MSWSTFPWQPSQLLGGFCCAGYSPGSAGAVYVNCIMGIQRGVCGSDMWTPHHKLCVAGVSVVGLKACLLLECVCKFVCVCACACMGVFVCVCMYVLWLIFLHFWYLFQDSNFCLNVLTYFFKILSYYINVLTSVDFIPISFWGNWNVTAALFKVGQ